LGNNQVASDPCEDCLIDHCTLEVFGGNAVTFGKAVALRRPILSRIWSHAGQTPTPAKSPKGNLNLVSGWSLNNENKYREQPVAPIVRLCYFGPDLDECHDQAWLHNKVSDTVVACCRGDRTGMANSKFNHRFGLRARYIGNFLPGFEVSWNDHECWLFGNKLRHLRVYAGKSALYDENSNDISGVGGRHACTSTRISGNDCAMLLGDNVAKWVTDKIRTNSGQQPPDPQPAGAAKPARTVQGATFAAFAAGDGISIRSHSGAIKDADPHPSGFKWVDNKDDKPDAPAPGTWRSDLFAQHPWIADLVVDPTNVGSEPWSLAESLTSGDPDAGTPHTGPFRKEGGGLLKT
jgi:hypothetical protein